MQVGEDSLWDALYEVMVEAEGVDADQQGDGVPGDVHHVIVAQIQVFQSLQEVLRWERKCRSPFATSSIASASWPPLRTVWSLISLFIS